MTPTAAELQADAEDSQPAPSRASLQELIALGEELERLEAEAAALQERLTEKNKQVFALKNVKLPRALQDLGLKNFTLKDGTTLTLSEVVKGQITEEHRAAAHEWLRANKFGDLIKNELKVTFGRGEDDYAKFLQNTIAEMREDGELRCGSVEQKEAVHPQTLYSFLRDRLATGQPFPAQLFGLDIFHVVKVNRVEKNA